LTKNITRIHWLTEVDLDDQTTLGGKAASLQSLATAFPVPPGYVIPTTVYEAFLEETGISNELTKLLEERSSADHEDLAEQARNLIQTTEVPASIGDAILAAYEDFGCQDPLVAVRSSAVGEDGGETSFAGQQETKLNIDRSRLIDAVQECWASLYTPRAIAYRQKNDYPLSDARMAVVVQRMVNADKSGVLFTRDPSTGEERTVIEGVWGLGEAVVSGTVTPDTYVIDENGGIEDLQVVEQSTMYTLDGDECGTVARKLSPDRREQRVLTDEELSRLATLGNRIESHYGEPQDIEWAIEDGEYYILQSRPITTLPESCETGSSDTAVDRTPILEGLGGSPGTGSGCVRILEEGENTDEIPTDAVLVSAMTTPDMMPALQRAAGIVTNDGGRTCHAAIVARELGVPAVLGTGEATETLTEGQTVTVDGDRGAVYEGASDLGEDESTDTPRPHPRKTHPVTATDVKVNVSLPSAAERAAELGVDGVGLMRLEHFVLSLGKTPKQFIADYGSEAYREKLRDGVGQVADAFYPRPVRVRTLDAPTDEFRELEGGSEEPAEQNPMLGNRGIRRSLTEPDIFQEELGAIGDLVDRGYDNIEILFPLVTETSEIAEARDHLVNAGIDADARRWGVMIETPASAVLIDDIVASGVDFVSFGTNDLTQYFLAVDRNNDRVADQYDETHPAIKRVLSAVVDVARANDVDVGICGEAASRPEVVDHLIRAGITSLSVNMDTVTDVRYRAKQTEQQLLLNTRL
jgi:pyruvate,water dikinase